MSASRLQVVVAEFIGTFALTFVGILSLGSGLIVGTSGEPAPLVVVALAHGLILGTMIAALGHISGGHFNPAVTFGFLVSGKFKVVDTIVYWVAQVVGALVAAYILIGMAGMNPVVTGTPMIAENVGAGMGLVLEAIGTFFLVLVVIGTVVDPRAPKSVYPFAIGLTLAAGIMAVGPITGGALNPARAFGPALATGDLSRQWVYWIGGLAGGAVAGIIYRYILRPQVVEA